jgi:hypothetical protein
MEIPVGHHKSHNLLPWINETAVGQRQTPPAYFIAARLAPSLLTLDLMPSFSESTSTSSSLIFELDLFTTEVEPAKAMTFFERHPSIEYLNVASKNNRRELEQLSSKFPPDLRVN